MRILLVSPYPPTVDGIGTYSQSLRGELVELGHEVAVVSARGDVPAPPEVIGVVATRPGAAMDRLLEAIDGFAPDVIHVQFAIAGYAASVFGVLALMRRLRDGGYRVVTTMHEVTRDTQSLRGLGRALYRALSARTDLAILHTQGAASCLTDLLGTARLQQEIIPHPSASLPDAGTSAAALRQQFGLGDGRVVLSFGFIDIDKGIQDLIRAVSLLRDDPAFADLRLVVAGTVRRRFGPFRIFEFRDRAYLAYLKRVTRQTGLKNRVTFAGYVPSGAMAPWFNLASVAALPYRRCEASGVANIALAAGTPLLTTAVGELVALSAIPDLAPRDPEAFAVGLTHLLTAAPPSGARIPKTGDGFSEIAARTASLYLSPQAVWD